ncbi:hypothetical protein RJ40_08385 [Methanofollis aquaemaris]|uniref:Uncharacterized protein n=1 Tax=Methanofollis aquaemaris TaxID=126734 RepID=A0A8A3SA84_9EURY|nr:hypothetical protein RJ40_08385 [Methanofollis aquaemaris]
MKNEEGVSEAIGFIIIFGLVMTGIALITLYGYPMLLQQQSNADVRNMEQTMVVLQNDIKSLCYKNVPYKETALQVAGGVLAVENVTKTGSWLNITASGNTMSFPTGMLIYTADSQDATIALENGAVIRAQTGGSSMIAEPRWYVDNNNGKKTFVINLVALNASTEMFRNGMGTVRMKLSSSNVSSLTPSDGNVQATYTGEFSKAWENYLNGTLKMTKSGNTYTLDGVDKLIIKKYEVEVLGI